MNPKVREILSEELKAMQDAGIMRPSKSLFSTMVVLVKKGWNHVVLC